MARTGITDEKDLKLLLGKLLADPAESFKFAVVATGPRDGELLLNKVEKFTKNNVEEEAQEEHKKANPGKAVRFEVIVGECRLASAGSKALKLEVAGKVAAKAVSCLEHLLTKGPFKTVGFTSVIIEEVNPTAPPTVAPTATATAAPPVPPAPPPQAAKTASPAPASPEASAFNQRLAEVIAAIKAAGDSLNAAAARVRASEAGTFARKLDFVGALQLLEEAVTALKAPPSTASPTPKSPPTFDLNTPDGRWNAARAEAVTKLFEELKWVLSTKDELAADAELELRAVIKQISGQVTNQKQADEMFRYLDEDDVVAAVCEEAHDIRTPLLAALREIREQLPA